MWDKYNALFLDDKLMNEKTT